MKEIEKILKSNERKCNCGCYFFTWLLFSSPLEVRKKEVLLIIFRQLIKCMRNRILQYELAIVLDSTNSDYFSNFASALVDNEQIQDAEEMYKRSLRLNPDNPNAVFNYAMMLQDRHKVHEAIKLYQHLITLEPDNSDAFSNLGSCLYEVEKFSLAINAFKRALIIILGENFEINPGAIQVGNEHAVLGSLLFEYIGRAYSRMNDDKNVIFVFFQNLL